MAELTRKRTVGAKKIANTVQPNRSNKLKVKVGNNGGQDLEQQIRETAYYLFERRGYSHGGDLADWLEAERIVRNGGGI